MSVVLSMYCCLPMIRTYLLAPVRMGLDPLYNVEQHFWNYRMRNTLSDVVSSYYPHFFFETTLILMLNRLCERSLRMTAHMMVQAGIAVTAEILPLNWPTERRSRPVSIVITPRRRFGMWSTVSVVGTMLAQMSLVLCLINFFRFGLFVNIVLYILDIDLTINMTILYTSVFFGMEH